MKKLFLCLLVVVAIAPINEVTADLFAGETFTMSINAAPADQSSFEDMNPGIGPFTFDSGVEVSVGVSQFDPTVEIFLLTVETVNSPDNSTIEIRMFGRDITTGDLANPIADGSLAANGQPFTIPFVDLGVFNGAGDLLTPTYLPGQNGYRVNAGFVGMISTADEIGGTNAPGLFSASPDGISTSVGFNLGSDLSTLDMNTISAAIWTQSAELAGWQIIFDVTVVPEPGSAALFSLMGLGLVLTRRRQFQ